MASVGLKSIAGVWQNIQEVDLRPIRAAAESAPRIQIAAEDVESGKRLAAYLLVDPSRSEKFQSKAGKSDSVPLILPSSLTITRPKDAQEVDADLLICLLTPDEDWPDVQVWVRSWLQQGLRVVLLIDSQGTSVRFLDTASGDPVKVIAGALDDPEFLRGPFTRAVLDLLPEHHIPLGRTYPLFRRPAAQRLIREVSNSNSIYAFSTGLAEMVPVLNLPFNVADIIVLTKAQALLVYKLGLMLGMPVEWQYYLGELGGVIGGGFLWRQIARSLVGLIPVWGIVPKVAVAYAGTFAVGEAVLQWYLTGRKITVKDLGAAYRRALDDGKGLAQRLVNRRKRKNQKALTAGEEQLCPACGTPNASKANFCQQCGAALHDLDSPLPDSSETS